MVLENLSLEEGGKEVNDLDQIMEKENKQALETDNSGKIIEINWIN